MATAAILLQHQEKQAFSELMADGCDETKTRFHLTTLSEKALQCFPPSPRLPVFLNLPVVEALG